MSMPYDHHTKAGNQGDVVKPHPGSRSYADLFSGYAHNPIKPGGSWRDGIGALRAKCDTGARIGNPDVERWYEWYVAPRPQLDMGVYPGSSVIAYDTAASLGTAVRLALWDTSQECIESLSSVFGDPHRVHHRKAEIDEEDVRTADFLLIDPPDKKPWPVIRSVLQAGRATSQPVLVWLPVATGKGETLEGEASIQYCDDAGAEGCEVLRVHWDAPHTHTTGCLLVYRLSLAGREAVRAAVHEVVSLAGWLANIPCSDSCR
jgi:23S rRNA A2030 N6-methylase RlmJ